MSSLYAILSYSSGSIEINHIDVSNLRRFSSRRNRIGSNRTNVTKSAVQWEFEYVFFALTLNPMRKRRCLEIEDYAGDTHSKTRRRMRPKRNVNRTSRPLHSPCVVSLPRLGSQTAAFPVSILYIKSAQISIRRIPA